LSDGLLDPNCLPGGQEIAYVSRMRCACSLKLEAGIDADLQSSLIAFQNTHGYYSW
jgi:hypothetical protein